MPPPAQQRGLVLVSSLLLLLVITMLALAMFRSTGLAEKISGNVREKERALHAALVAEQYAEWWLSNTANSSQAPVSCNASDGTGNADQSSTQVVICNNALVNPAAIPWIASTSGAQVGFTYYPNSGAPSITNMSFVPDSTGSYSNTYTAPPAFYITFMGVAAAGSVYKIDAVGYGGSALSVAVVESTYEIGSGVIDRGGL
jgi:type IV pilus assembly protein PilX